jgi:protein-S-isoprenylcysteine O-methyltransferase Ste14
MSGTSLLRRVGIAVWFVVYHVLMFVALPMLFIAWNAELGWGVWTMPLTRGLGIAMVLAGAAVIAYCTGLFAWVGRGTPVPIAPPEVLVTGGLFRYSRNPIYVADALIWLGVFFWQGHLSLLLLVAMGTATIYLVVVWSEEPAMRKRFGQDFDDYCARVPRWVGTRRS